MIKLEFLLTKQDCQNPSSGPFNAQKFEISLSQDVFNLITSIAMVLSFALICYIFRCRNTTGYTQREFPDSTINSATLTPGSSPNNTLTDEDLFPNQNNYFNNNNNDDNITSTQTTPPSAPNQEEPNELNESLGLFPTTYTTDMDFEVWLDLFNTFWDQREFPAKYRYDMFLISLCEKYQNFLKSNIDSNDSRALERAIQLLREFRNTTAAAALDYNHQQPGTSSGLLDGVLRLF